ncbi:MAG: class I SAM-dependent methyltransferase [Opitutaceae bacterium]|jgi:2-polyprenyl-3-methyl-5-hydroxy-6-metoxy-1,4-benzoquinol methylase
MQYDFANDPEFHVWDLATYESIDAEAAFSSGWMGKYLRREDAVLDVGCGPGYTVKVLQDLGYSVLGVDLNKELISRAQRVGLNVVEEDGLVAIRKHADKYNVICMSDFVEHVPLKVVVDICAEIARFPGKRVFLCTPNLDSVMGFKFWFHMPTHVNAMHPFVIRNMLKKLGYRVIEEWTEYGQLPGKGWKLKLRRWLLIKLLGPAQAQLFFGGANVCFFAEVKG